MSTVRGALWTAVRTKRVEIGISQERLGELADLDRIYISGVERGIRNPTVESLWRIASALGSAPSEIVADAEAHLRPRKRWPATNRQRPED